VDYPGSRSALPGYGLTGSAKQSGKQRGWIASSFHSSR
jgi:hypothetical protein